MLKSSRYFAANLSLSTSSTKLFTTIFGKTSKINTLFVFPNESHILSQHMQNWTHPSCHHNIIYAENNLDLSKAILNFQPKILVLSDNTTIRNISQLNKELEWIHLMNTTASFEDILIRMSDQNKITLTTSRSLVNHVVSEYIVGMVFYHLKALKFVLQKNELRNLQTIAMKKLEGSSFLFLGFDYALLDCFNKIKTAFDCKITVADNITDSTIINEMLNLGVELHPLTNLMSLFRDSDVIVNCLPYEHKTNKILAYKEFKEMKNRTIFINVGDFNQVDELALMEALINSKILGASVDLQDAPDSKSPLFDCERLLLTHDNADFYGLKWIDSMKFWDENLKSFLKKQKMLGTVDPKTGRHTYN